MDIDRHPIVACQQECLHHLTTELLPFWLNRCKDGKNGGYWEMFERDWTRCGPGSAGGDRKTLDVHMHLMEASTSKGRTRGACTTWRRSSGSRPKS